MAQAIAPAHEIMKQPTTPISGSLIRSLGLTLGIVLLSHCSAPVSVRMEKPVAPVGAPATSAGMINSIRESHDRIRRGDDSAIPAYNHSVARLIEELEHTGADPWSGTISYSGTSGTFRLKGSHPANSKPLQNKLIPTDTLNFRGEIAAKQSHLDGLGAPVVEVGALDKLWLKAFGHPPIPLSARSTSCPSPPAFPITPSSATAARATRPTPRMVSWPTGAPTSMARFPKKSSPPATALTSTRKASPKPAAFYFFT